MADIEDMVTRAIQAYADDVATEDDYPSTTIALLALADSMAPYLVEKLGLKQEWGIAISYPPDPLDEVSHRSDTPDWPRAELERLGFWDAELNFNDESRRYLAFRLYTDWTEEQQASLDPDLVQLAADDEVDV